MILLISRQQLIYQQKEAKSLLENLFGKEETLWAQKSRVKWLREGDRCSSYLYHKVKQRRSWNSITALESTNGVYSEDHDVMKEGLVHFYKQLYTDPDSIPSHVKSPRRYISKEDKAMLDRQVTAEAIKLSVMSVNPDKAPGPDGPARFYHKLCTVLQSVIGKEQVAFIKNKTVHDNIIMVSDLLKGFNCKRGDRTMAMKIDLQKAYDTVSWTFISQIMQAYGFGQIWFGWVHEFVSSAKFSIFFNGVPAGYFNACRLAEDEINSGRLHLSKAADRAGVKISHVFYADDLFLVVKANFGTAKAISDVFGEFQTATGLKINKDECHFEDID
ncbi:uncharacterized protein LOC132272928 [Cornus florida]|uniref:uncharacterized protein LOC132272928 n=1 Tax=Cornus florida TaxID=4283 RepID=UPI002897311C|nr:uncharacterized protein LOC132272928 [Cornus florida]